MSLKTSGPSVTRLEILSTNMSKAMGSRNHYNARTKWVLCIGVGGLCVFLQGILRVFLQWRGWNTADFGELNKHSWDRLWLPSGQLPSKAEYFPYWWIHLTNSRPEIRVAVHWINELPMTSKSSLAYGDWWRRAIDTWALVILGICICMDSKARKDYYYHCGAGHTSPLVLTKPRL